MAEAAKLKRDLLLKPVASPFQLELQPGRIRSGRGTTHSHVSRRCRADTRRFRDVSAQLRALVNTSSFGGERRPTRALIAMLGRTLTAWGALFAVACAAPSNYYARMGVVLNAVDEPYRASLLRQLTDELRESDIDRVELRSAQERVVVQLIEGRAAELERFPICALRAALFGAQEQLRGAEFDLLIRDREPRDRVVTVRHDIDGRLTVVLGGPPIRLTAADVPGSELQRRYGIGSLLDGDAAWTGDERQALDAALSLLSGAELAYLKLLPFRRDTWDRSDVHAGLYKTTEEHPAGLIVLLDNAFRADENVFIGTAERAYPSSVNVILHEIGHAIAKLDRAKIRYQLKRDAETYNRLVEVSNQYAHALNQRYRLIGRVVPMDRARLRGEIEALEGEHRELRQTLRDARKQLDEMVDLVRGPSPIERVYSELPGARAGPTAYGKTSIAESFAEAFALFHLDPESILRISPEVHRWFAGEQHLAAAMFPEVPDAEPPPEVTPPPSEPDG